MPSDDPSATPPLPILPRRDPKGHKGTFGTVAVFGGHSSQKASMVGAPALAALGASRAGAGLVRLVMPRPILDSGILIAPGATGVGLVIDHDGDIIAHEASRTFDTVVASSDAIVVGPGLGKGIGIEALVLRAVQQESLPLILDADGLNALASIPEFTLDFRARAILTPHPGEFRRLAQPLAISHDPVDPKTRPLAAQSLAQRLGCIVVLKGAGTIVSDGLQTWTCTRGHPCLATGGTGDVLAGVIAGLAAQFARDALTESLIARGMSSPASKPELSLFDLARLGVQAHAIAGEMWAKSHHAEAGLIPTELAGIIPEALESLRG